MSHVAELSQEVARLESVSKTYSGIYSVPALRKCNLSISRGDYLTIQGPSGSGKSTLLNILGLLDTPTSGRYLLAGEDIAGASDTVLASLRATYLGFVFQAAHLIEQRPAIENVQLGAIYAGTAKTERRTTAMRLLYQVGLGHRAWAQPSTLSGGERQRVAIARALMNKPDLLLCDEPTGNLDSGTSQSVLEVLEALNSEGLTVVVITHDDSVAKRSKRRLKLVDGFLSEL
jgi:putative ABC transport system ATP-binding protein